MKLSDAIERGAGILGTPGPAFPHHDVLVAAQAGELGRIPSSDEQCVYYWGNSHGAGHGSDLEYWMRMVTLHEYRWFTVIQKLRGYGR